MWSKLVACFLVAVVLCGQIQVSSRVSFITDANYNKAGWASWGGNNKIFYTTYTTGYYEVHQIDPDGTNDSCLTCGNASFPANVSRGALQLRPISHDYAMLQVQKSGSTNTDLPPGNGTDYDVAVCAYPGLTGCTIISGATTASLWPFWSRSGTKVGFTQWYQAADATHPQGYWKAWFYSFTAPSTFTLINSCEISGHEGMHELGEWYDNQYVWIMAPRAPTAGNFYKFIGYKMNTADCSTTQATYDAQAWTEHARFAGQQTIWPYMFYISSRNNADSTSLNLKADVWVRSLHPLTLLPDSEEMLINCNRGETSPASYTTPTACIIQGISPDGTKGIMQVQWATGLGSLDPRRLDLITFSYKSTMKNGVTLSNGVTFQ